MTADNHIAEARRAYSEEFYFQLEKKAGSRDALLALTSGKPRGEVEFIVSTLFDELIPEGTAGAALACTSRRFLLDEEALMDTLEAAA